MIVVHVSVLVALLAGRDAVAAWARATMKKADRLAAPDHCVSEAVDVVRSLELGGHIGAAEAAMAHTGLRRLPLDLCPYSLLADVAWPLRYELSVRDASYVALAQMLKCPLATADIQLATRPLQLDVEFLTPT